MYEPSKLFTLPLCEGGQTFSPDLVGLIAWLETMPPEREYCYTNIGHCLVAQFFAARGAPNIIVSQKFIYYCDNAKGAHPYPAAFDEIAKGGFPYGRTFGDALSRARSALMESAR